MPEARPDTGTVCRVHAAGTRLTSAHLGATLMALAGLDPTRLVPGAAPVSARIFPLPGSVLRYREPRPSE